jgi:AcrR family transcriptional regulator
MTPSDETAKAPPHLRADARRNRERILAAARAVFIERGIDAPLDEIAQRSGVGIATLYRRFPTRQALIEAVALDIVRQTAEEAALALAEEPSPLSALTRYMHRALDLHVGVLMPSLVGGQQSTRNEEFLRAREAGANSIRTIVDRAKADGSIRPDVTAADIGLLIIRLNRPLLSPFPRDLADCLSHRHMELVIDGLRLNRNTEARTLPGPAMTFEELRELPLQNHDNEGATD